MAGPAGAQQAPELEARKAQAVELFLHGKVNTAIQVQQDIIATAPPTLDGAVLRRDLMEMCATAHHWECVARTIKDLLPAVRTDPGLGWIRYELVAYGARLALWRQDDAELARALGSGLLAQANPLDNPAAAAELELALHEHAVRGNDLKSAEKSLSSAILGLLLSDSYGKYRQAELSLRVLQALVDARDVVGAMNLADKLAPIMRKVVAADSVIAARYLMLVAHLRAYTENYSATAAAFMDASRAIAQLDIDESAKSYDLSVANSLATAALVLDGRPAEAQELHARHPLQAQKETILARGEFLALQEFYFAVSDVFLSAVLKTRSDFRWKPLLEKQFRWRLDVVEAPDLESYRRFALGIFALDSGNVAESAGLLRLAAAQRIDAFDVVLRANSEGFPLPSLMDLIIIGFGLSVVDGSVEHRDLDLMLRGSEVLGRNPRHALVDAAVLMGAQAGEAARRGTQAYIGLLRQKRDWEIEHITALLARDGAWDDRPQLVREYTALMNSVNDTKDRLVREQQLAATSGLPRLTELQKAIPPGDAFVTYFVSLQGIGKLCISRDRIAHAIAPFEPQLATHSRLLDFAMTASYPANPQLDAQFPVASAIYMRQFYFGGLESCMPPGTHVTVTLSRGFAIGIPFGALLAEAPPALPGGGYDLGKAHWLVRDLSFSRVVSAREYLATMPYLARAPAPRPYLGVGDPELDKPDAAQSTRSAAFRASLPTPNGMADFAELPETAEELRSVSGLFGVSDVLTRENADEKSFRAKPLGDYDVIHFATHGLIKEDLPGLTESALVLTPGRGEDASDDGLLSASEISRLALNARLVVLSACNTAKYDIAQASLGVQDLQAAFAVAGTPVLLASLWPIESATARDIAVGFFREWRSRETRGAADALARATRASLAQADAAHQHPRFWAPFVIVGNGAVSGAAGSQ
jgi:CHAT domain